MNKISIALCTYNGSNYLKEQLYSLTTQVRQPDEVVICDDGSNNRTMEIIDHFSRTMQFEVKVFKNEHNLGITKNFEKAIGLCTGNLIALCDQDDVWHPRKIDKCEKKFEKRLDLGAVFCNAEVVDKFLNPLGYSMWQKSRFTVKEQQRMLNGEAFAILLKHYIVTGATIMFRAKFKPIILPIPSVWFHDAWISLLIASMAKIEYISESMIKYRQHSNNELGGIQKRITIQIAEAFQTDRDNYYKFEKVRCKLAFDRILNISDSFNTSINIFNNLYILEEKIKHLQIRAEMHRNRLLRIPAVLNELIQLRYYRYARNWGSVAMDLLFS